ncbi:hypothetical protein ACOSQ4_009170 [Xanthoceras sorbifolium]
MKKLRLETEQHLSYLHISTLNSLIISLSPMALSLIPSSSSSAPQFKYDVFLSFRGEDTRYNFISHLHKALCDKHIEIFIDYNLNRGDEISPSLLEAIEESQISIIIFSRNYASSRWCLEELVKILECREQYGQIMIPVFYGIDPSAVRKQTGSFLDAFAKHEQKSSHKVQIWKEALKKAANLSGWHSTANKPESVLIEDIVQSVLKRLNAISSVDTSDLVGIDSKIEEIESLLCIGTNDARSVGIWGIGGIGKTTLAEAVFDKISSQFERSWFTYDVRERSEQSGGLNHLQQELRLAILGDGNMNVCTSIVGRTFIRKRYNRKKLLLILDDVSNFRQIEYLIGGSDCLTSQSRIIITSRDKQVLKNCGVNKVYKVRELFHDEALKLFCRYAFKRNHPMMGYVELSNKVAEYAQGVPLALKVLGSHLLDKGKEVWKSAIDKLETFPHIDIHKVMKISYDGLDDDVRKIFLDIACFLKYYDTGLAKSILNACGFHSEIGISILINQSLIAINDINKITIHDLLQAMGREIVRQESIDNPGKRSRLWHHEDIYYVLTKNKGSEIIEGISLDMSKIRDIHLDRNAFTNMRRLSFLNFYSRKVGFFAYYREVENKVHGFEAVKSDLPELRYLCWDGCPIKSLSSSFHLENLVKLDMRYSKVEQIWNGVKHLFKLKEIDLSFSSLRCCPDLSGFPNLEKLILYSCLCLREILPSIQYLNKLDFLNLKECRSLQDIPDCRGLISLKKLDLRWCSSLKKLPEMPCNIEELLLSGTAIEELPLSTKYLSRLVVLDVSYSTRLKSFPSSICEWKSLKDLYLIGCSKLDELPDDIGTLESLEGLNIYKTSSITKLKNVNSLIFKRFMVQDAVSWFLPRIEGWHNLTSLDLSDSGIIELPENLGCLSSLRELNLARNSFESIPASIANLSNLLYLYINNCKKLKCLPKPQLFGIDAYNCTSLEVLSNVSFKSCFQIGNCFKLDNIFANFGNCFKLDRNTFENIVKDVLLKIRGPVEYSYEDCEYPISPLAHSLICYPGYEIPEWFNFRSMGSLINVELPPNCLNHNFIGFVMCLVVAPPYLDHQVECNTWSLHWECNLKSKDGHPCNRDGSFGYDFDFKVFGSHHVFMASDFEISPYEFLDYENEISFEFYCEDGMEGYTVEKCGLHLMCAQLPQEANVSYQIGEVEDFLSLASVHDNCEEIDEQHPKRLKFN